MADRALRGMGLVLVLIVLAGFAGWRAIGDAPASGATSSGAPDSHLTALMPYAAPLADTVRLALTRPDSVTIPRDPFAISMQGARGQRPRQAGSSAHAVAKAERAPWRVTATLIAGDRRAAIINDALVYLGDSVPGGGKLTAVERDRIVVTDAKGVPHTLDVKNMENIG